MEEIEVRPLKVKDVFAVARMLGKVTRGARLQLASALTEKKPNYTELGITLFQSLFTEAEEDLKAWLADLMGKKVAEFEAMPATAVLGVVEKLASQEDIKDFFGKALLLVNKVSRKG